MTICICTCGTNLRYPKNAYRINCSISQSFPGLLDAQLLKSSDWIDAEKSVRCSEGRSAAGCQFSFQKPVGHSEGWGA